MIHCLSVTLSLEVSIIINAFEFKVHLTPNFFSAQINLHIGVNRGKNVLICLNPRLSIAGRNMENSTKMWPYWFTSAF